MRQQNLANFIAGGELFGQNVEANHARASRKQRALALVEQVQNMHKFDPSKSSNFRSFELKLSI